ncbi:hypothetical protein M405DRAFT_365657 [Rhizopogon salebrosus TDB-379]|nr:hypothetical protein M405DRAFT_365657 [Rhizopogon salebrosus TDB-379]
MLMLYTISLHIAATAGACHQLGVLIFATLHTIPAIGIFIVMSVQLAFTVESPATAISGIMLCSLPIMVTIFLYLYTVIFPLAPSAEESVPV